MEASGSKSIGKDHEIQMASATPLKSTAFDALSVEAEELYVWSAARSQDESRANIAVS